MLLKVNKILPNFRESSSNSINDHSILCYHCNQEITCTTKKPKVRTNMSNEDKYVKVNR